VYFARGFAMRVKEIVIPFTLKDVPVTEAGK
jgi:hypothetical protein